MGDNSLSDRERYILTVASLKVSNVNNPFVFPDIKTYTIGTGKIMAIGANGLRMSEGQFGQYNLYVLTSLGVYSLDTGQDIAYAKQAPASLMVPISDVICVTPFGLVFFAKRGLYIINGQNVEPLTTQLETYPTQINLDIPKIGVLPNRSDIKTWNDHFLEYLDGITEIAYDNKESELIPSQPKQGRLQLCL